MSVADLLIGAGAVAVLSTLVPVDVSHNSQIVSRFFLYLALAADGQSGEPEKSVLDVWHRVQSTNAPIDIAYGNRRMLEWVFERVDGVSPLERFMAPQARIPLRGPHLYADAEARLVDIARQTGDAARVQGWLRAPGYLPETMMYTFLGKPSSLLLRPPPLRYMGSVPVDN